MKKSKFIFIISLCIISNCLFSQALIDTTKCKMVSINDTDKMYIAIVKEKNNYYIETATPLRFMEGHSDFLMILLKNREVITIINDLFGIMFIHNKLFDHSRFIINKKLLST